MLVVGAGPVGIITAMYLARRGYTVQIVERNADPSETESLGTPDCDVPVILSSRWGVDTQTHTHTCTDTCTHTHTHARARARAHMQRFASNCDKRVSITAHAYR